jgi:hypothetical protein
LLLGLDGAVDPGAWHQPQAVPGGDLGHVVAAIGGSIGSDIVDMARHHGEVVLDLLLARFHRRRRFLGEGGAQEAQHATRLGRQRVLVLGPGRVGDAVQGPIDIGGGDMAVEKTPPHGRSCGDDE